MWRPLDPMGSTICCVLVGSLTEENCEELHVQKSFINAKTKLTKKLGLFHNFIEVMTSLVLKKIELLSICMKLSEVIILMMMPNEICIKHGHFLNQRKGSTPYGEHQ